GVPQAKPATIKTAIRPSLMRVETFCSTLPLRTPDKWTSEMSHVAARPTARAGAPAIAPAQYCPRAIAARATGAANPTVADTHPARKPTAGWKVRDRKLYSPPERGKAAASSE